MGNSITKKFDVPKEHTATAGHLQLWKIWPGKSKDGGTAVSIWTFDKAELAKKKTVSGTAPYADKAILEQVYQIMKKDMAVIKDMHQSSSVINCLEVIEESKTALVFTTERIVCSLADILYNFEQVPGGQMYHSEFFDNNGALSEIEISRAFLLLAQGIQYLHNVQRRLHLNVTPENIVITASGLWKLCGFGFSLDFAQGDLQRLASPYFLKSNNREIRLEPDLCFSAPECTDGGYNPPGTRMLSPACDAFSLALLFYEVYRFNIKLSPRERSAFAPCVNITGNDAAQHLMALEVLRQLDYSFLAGGIDRLVTGLLQLNTQIRLSINDIVNNSYFVTGAQAVINTLESINSKDIGTQSSLLVNMEAQVINFPARVLKFMVLPTIGHLCLQSPALWEFALPLHEALSKLMPTDQYKAIAAPFIAAGLAVTSPPETIQTFLFNMKFIAKTFDAVFFQTNATTLFCTALDKTNNFLQNAAFETLWDDELVRKIDGPPLVDKLVPQICKEACKNPDPNIKIQALFVLSLFISKLDRKFIAASLLPSFKYITDNDRTPMVAMHVVGCYEVLADGLGYEYIASAILPSILPMLVEKTMNKAQFETVIDLVKALLRRIADARTKELGIEPIAFGESKVKSTMDPFAGAKSILMSTRSVNRHSRGGNHDGRGDTVSYGSHSPPPAPSGLPPPLPSGPPPPPPSGPPPPLPNGAAPSAPPAGFAAESTTPPALPFGGANAALWAASMQANISVAPSSTFNSAFRSDTAPIPPSVPPAPPIPPSVPSAPPAPTPTAPATFASLPLSSAPLVPAPAAAVPIPVPAPAPAPAARSSSFGWFSSSSKSKKEEKEPEYVPPVVAVESTVSKAADLDMDDFMSSFSKPAASAQAPAPAPQASSRQSFIQPAAAAPIAPTASPYATPAAASAYVAPAGPSYPLASSQYGGNKPVATVAPVLGLEEQLRQTQEQIAKLSGGYGNPTPAAKPQTAAISGYTAPIAGYSAPAPTPAATTAAPAYSYKAPTVSAFSPAPSYGSNPQQAYGSNPQSSYGSTPTYSASAPINSTSTTAGMGSNMGNSYHQPPTAAAYGMPTTANSYHQPAAAATYGMSGATNAYHQHPTAAYGMPAAAPTNAYAPNGSLSAPGYPSYSTPQQPTMGMTMGMQSNLLNSPPQPVGYNSYANVNTLPRGHPHSTPNYAPSNAGPYYSNQQSSQSNPGYSNPTTAGRIGSYPGAAASSGYVPPVSMAPQQQQQPGNPNDPTRRASSSVSSAFDFLN